MTTYKYSTTLAYYKQRQSSSEIRQIGIKHVAIHLNDQEYPHID